MVQSYLPGSPVCPSMRAHWHHLANTIELCFLRPSRIHNSNNKSIGSAVFAQITAECRCTLQRSRSFLPLKFPLPMGDLDPHPTRFLRPIRAHNRNSIFIVECPYTLEWDAPSPSELSLPMDVMGDLDPILYMIPWAHPSPQPKWYLCRFSHFCRVSSRLPLV